LKTLTWESRIKHHLKKTWLYPRHISQIYLGKAIQRASIYAQGILIDVGCGIRPYEPVLKKRVNKYIGVDWPVSPEKACQDVTCDASTLPFFNEVADTVLSTELMEHLKEPNHLLDEVARILKTGGYFLLSVPFLEPLHEEPRDFYRFTEYGLKTILNTHGFEVKHMWERGHWWAVVLGSFIPQALFSYASRPNKKAGFLKILLVLPICALAQLIGYFIDPLAKPGGTYTLGFFVVAVRHR
jgi:SAM-dependent methyltransferase